ARRRDAYIDRSRDIWLGRHFRYIDHRLVQRKASWAARTENRRSSAAVHDICCFDDRPLFWSFQRRGRRYIDLGLRRDLGRPGRRTRRSLGGSAVHSASPLPENRRSYRKRKASPDHFRDHRFALCVRARSITSASILESGKNHIESLFLYAKYNNTCPRRRHHILLDRAYCGTNTGG